MRKRHPMTVTTQPSAEEVLAARTDAKLTQAQAAEVVGLTTRAWQYYEAGAYLMKVPTWRLFLAMTRKRSR
jgi:DNA-binding XRE family transcriptional regulator